jgi:hypothetical protein
MEQNTPYPSYENAAQKEFLFREYESAVELTNHIDELRNKLTSFYLAFAGAAGAGLVLILKGDLKDAFSRADIYFLSGLFLLLVSVIGVFVVHGLGRLRYVQIEYFGIVSRIRAAFFQQDANLWKIVPHRPGSEPEERILSGSYMWLLMVTFINSTLLAVSACLIAVSFRNDIAGNAQFTIGLIAFVVYKLLQHFLYMKIAQGEWGKPKETEAPPLALPKKADR